MRFLQSRKFSYLMKYFFDVDPYEEPHVLAADRDKYRQFLKSVLVENVLSVIFMITIMHHILFYLELRDDVDVHLSIRRQIKHPGDSSLLKLDENIIYKRLFRELVVYRHKLKHHKRLKTHLISYLNKNFSLNLMRVKNDYDKTNRTIEAYVDFNTDALADLNCTGSIRLHAASLNRVRIDTSLKLNHLFFSCLILNSAHVFNITVRVNYRHENSRYELHLAYENLAHMSPQLIPLPYRHNKVFTFANVLSTLVLNAFLLVYLAEELLELCAYRLGHYDLLLNFNDVLVLMLALKYDFDYVNLVVRLVSVQGDLTDVTLGENYILGLLVLLVWMKQFKFINFTSGLTRMNATLTRSFGYLVCYFGFYAVVFVMHAELIRRLLGHELAAFSSVHGSLFSLFKLILPAIDFLPIYDSYKLQWIFFSFYVMVYVFMAGIFLAIISDSYSYVLENHENLPELDYSVLFKPPDKTNNPNKYGQFKFLHRRFFPLFISVS